MSKCACERGDRESEERNDGVCSLYALSCSGEIPSASSHVSAVRASGLSGGLLLDAPLILSPSPSYSRYVSLSLLIKSTALLLCRVSPFVPVDSLYGPLAMDLFLP